MADGVEVHAEDRFTWERIIMRARLDGVISGSGKVSERTGKQTRGGISGPVFKAVALVFAAHADEDGSAVRPGDMRVAILAEVHPRTVKAVREKLVELGLMRQTGRYGHTPMYRLTLPSDLTEMVIVLSPTEVVETAKAMRARTREAKAASRNGCTGGAPIAEEKGVPAEHPKPPDDGPDGPGGPGNGCTGGAPEIPNGCSAGQDMGDPPVTLYQPLTGHLKITNPTDDDDLRTAVTGPREERTPKPDPSPRPAKCSAHGLGGGLRPDGLPECTLCRREQRTGGPPPEPEPPGGRPRRCDHTPLPGKDRCRICAAPPSNVIDLNSRRTA